MNAKTISIYVGNKLVLRATDLKYDEDTGKRNTLIPPGAVFQGQVGQVLVQDAAGNVVRSADGVDNDLKIVAELF